MPLTTRRREKKRGTEKSKPEWGSSVGYGAPHYDFPLRLEGQKSGCSASAVEVIGSPRSQVFPEARDIRRIDLADFFLGRADRLRAIGALAVLVARIVALPRAHRRF